MKASIRIKTIDKASLGTAEKHGKRLDETSQARRLNDNRPLVYQGLNLQNLYDNHIKNCKKNASLKKPIQHAFVQFPIDIEPNKENQHKFLKSAVEFINQTHGGQAVFAARLDRDEAGKHGVDVFFCEKYIKKTKSRGEELWITNSKHGKILCEKHRDEIERRNNGVFNTTPRSCGMALQSEFRNFLENKHNIKLDPKKEKTSKKQDRLTPELYKIHKLKGKLHHFRKAMRFFKKNFENLEDVIHPAITKALNNPFYTGVTAEKEAPKPQKSATETPPRRSRTDEDIGHTAAGMKM